MERHSLRQILGPLTLTLARHPEDMKGLVRHDTVDKFRKAGYEVIDWCEWLSENKVWSYEVTDIPYPKKKE